MGILARCHDWSPASPARGSSGTDSPERATRELDKLVKQKLAKGYADAQWRFDFDSGLAVVEVVDLPPRERHPKQASFTVVGEPAGDARGRVIVGEVAMILRAAGSATVVELYTKRGDVLGGGEHAPGRASGRAVFVRRWCRCARGLLAGCAVR
jgi:hypothetical protein